MIRAVVCALSVALAVSIAACASSDAINEDDAGNTATGDPFDTPEPDGSADPCAQGDCPSDDAGDGGAPATDAATSPWVVGAKLLTRGYSTFRKTASTTAATIAVAPGAGVANDSIHLWSNPLGTIPPGQDVVLANAQKTNGFWEVTYDGKTGFVSASHLFVHDTSQNPVDFFLSLSPLERNAFYKRQAHRSQWNADGPSMSGTCAPTSLAMAVSILGREPAHSSVEQSIHRIRTIYGDSSDLGGTTNAQIYTAAVSSTLGLHATKLWTALSLSAALTRLDAELAKKHVVQLAGVPGQVGSARSVYEKAFDAAYAAANVDAIYGFDPDSCNCSGTHSILVVGRDASGNYVVGDPMSEIGFLAISPAAMKDYMLRWTFSGTGNAVW